MLLPRTGEPVNKRYEVMGGDGIVVVVIGSEVGNRGLRTRKAYKILKVGAVGQVTITVIIEIAGKYKYGCYPV